MAGWSRGRFGAVAAMMLVACALASTAQAAAPVRPDAWCGSLATLNLADLPEAPTRIVAASQAQSDRSRPAHCRVEGVIGEAIGFELSLPLAGWNGKFAHSDGQFSHIGCVGADCGPALSRQGCDGPLRRGYACMVQDWGRRATGAESGWARDNDRAKLDFAFRAVHLGAVAGKAITAAALGRTPSRAYFLGCSVAGRQGLIAAQAFPDDYDGIVAGAPATRPALNAMAVLWNVGALLDANGKSLFPAPDGGYLQPDLRLFHKGLIAECDGDDGVMDGIIGDPRQCRYDPARLQCAGPKTPTCLTAEQVAAIRKILNGPSGSRGDRLFHAALPGSEVNWGYSYLSVEGGAVRRDEMWRSLFRDFGLAPAPAEREGPVDWDDAARRMDMQDALYGAANPDLRRFKARGGKLIAYQGWSDHEVLPEAIVDYYEATTRTMGGPGATGDFFRLFMIPGMDHCGNGVAADKIDYLTALEAWVERGRAPDVLIASRVRDLRVWPAESDYWDLPRWDASRVAFTRPIYPYPLKARYAGVGDPNDAASFKPVPPPEPGQ